MYVISNRGGNGLSYLHGKNGEESTAVKFRGSLMTELRDAAPGETPRIMVVVHGFNNGWEDTLQFFEKLDTNLAPRVQGGPVVTVGFSWPSDGKVTHYLDDRMAAQASAPDIATAMMGAVRILESTKCPAELVLVCHSMGSYAMAHAMRSAWEHLGHPSNYNVFSEILLAFAMVQIP